MSDGTDLSFYVTLCARHSETQRILLEGSEGTIEWNYNDMVTIRKSSGTESFNCAIRTIPSGFAFRSDSPDEPGAYVEGIETTIKDAFASGKLFSETGVPWAEASEPFVLSDYRFFPQRFRMNG